MGDTESSPSLAGMVIMRHEVRLGTPSRPRPRRAGWTDRLRGARGVWGRARGPRWDYASTVMDTPVTPRDAAPGPRRRDRHAEACAAPWPRPGSPLREPRRGFADLVQDSVERLERHWPQLADIDFLVLEVPRLDGTADAWDDEAVPLGARSRHARAAGTGGRLPPPGRDQGRRARRARRPGARGRGGAGGGAARADPGDGRPALRRGLIRGRTGAGRGPRAPARHFFSSTDRSSSACGTATVPGRREGSAP